MTVAANLRYPARWRRGTGRDFDRVTAMLGLEPLLARRPATLSGGERQRTAIGRALLSDPALLVMDEPLAALDQARKSEIMPWLERLRDQARLPILYVSHSVPEVLRLATTIVLMRAGRVTHAGPLTELLADPDLAPQLGTREAGALIEARVMAHEVILSRQAPVGLSALNALPVRVLRIEGGLVQLALGNERMLAQVTPRSLKGLELQPSTDCYAIVKTVSILPS